MPCLQRHHAFSVSVCLSVSLPDYSASYEWTLKQFLDGGVLAIWINIHIQIQKWSLDEVQCFYIWLVLSLQDRNKKKLFRSQSCCTMEFVTWICCLLQMFRCLNPDWIKCGQISPFDSVIKKNYDYNLLWSGYRGLTVLRPVITDNDDDDDDCCNSR